MTPSILRRNNRPAVLRGAIAPSAGLYPSGAATNAGPHTLRASTSRLLTDGPSSVGPTARAGGYGLVLTANNVQTDVARMGALFTQAAQDLGVPAYFEEGWVEPTFRRDNTGTFFWTLPVRVNTFLANSDALKRAFARAIFWSSMFTRDAIGGTDQIDKQNSDGGASILNAINAHGAFSVTPREGTFGRITQGGVAPGSVPGSSTPPPGPVGGDSIVPIGGPERMSVADLLSSFCNKRPKDSEGALTARDRQEYQAALTRLGFSTQGVDGVIGGNTRTAVQSFQRSRNITSQGQPGYGTIGPQTQAALIRAVCQGVNAAEPQTVPATPTTPATPTMPLPTTPSPLPATPTTPRTSTPSTPQTAQPLANTQPPVEAGMGAGPMLLLAAAGAAAVFLYTQGSKKSGKEARS